MTEPNLLDRMMESTSWTRTETVDPAADLARGRRRLRVRRTRIGAAAVSAVAVTAFGVNTLTGSIGTAPSPSPAATPNSARASELCPGEGVPVEDSRRRHIVVTGEPVVASVSVGSAPTWNAEATRLLRVVAKHVDPDGEYPITKVWKHGYGCTMGYQDKVKAPWIAVWTTWRQDLRSAVVALRVYQPGDYNDPKYGPSALPHLRACQDPPWPDVIPHTCSWREYDGKRVLLWKSVKQSRYYLAGYVRPDGQMVTLEIRSNIDDPKREGGAPVRDLAVTPDQLAAAVTDPEMTLR